MNEHFCHFGIIAVNVCFYLVLLIYLFIPQVSLEIKCSFTINLSN